MSDNLPVPVDKPAVLPAPGPEFGIGDKALLTEGAKFFTCLDPAKEGGLIASCLDGEDLHFDEAIGQQINLVAFVMHQWESTDPKTGEVTDGIRVVLTEDRRRRLVCPANPVRRTLGYLAQFCGRPPWNPPLVCRLELGKNRYNFRFFKLSYLPSLQANGAALEPGKKGGK